MRCITLFKVRGCLVSVASLFVAGCEPIQFEVPADAKTGVSTSDSTSPDSSVVDSRDADSGGPDSGSPDSGSPDSTPTTDLDPIAVIDGLVQAGPNETILLSGAGSYDPDGQAIVAWEWSSDVTDLTPVGVDAWLGANSPGTYSTTLRVQNDAGVWSAPVSQTLEIVPIDALYVELTWDTTYADVDLHLVAEGGVLYQIPYDCSWCNQQAAWASASDVDDATLVLDDRVGFGPEAIGVPAPAAGIYTVYVDYYADNSDGPTEATVKIWLGGALVHEDAVLLAPEEAWSSAAITWVSSPNDAVIAAGDGPVILAQNACF